MDKQEERRQRTYMLGGTYMMFKNVTEDDVESATLIKHFVNMPNPSDPANPNIGLAMTIEVVLTPEGKVRFDAAARKES